MHGKQEVAITPATLQGMPYAVPVHTPARYNAMNVRVVEKVGTPSVENAGHASL